VIKNIKSKATQDIFDGSNFKAARKVPSKLHERARDFLDAVLLMRSKNRAPRHPGEILQRVFLEDMGITQSGLANHLKWKPGKINEIVNKKRGITAETALALADALKTTPEFWLNLQSNYDLWQAEQSHTKVSAISA